MAKSRKDRDDDFDDVGPKPASDAYTGLLLLALIAQIAGAVFLFLDYNQYPEKKPSPPRDKPAAAAAPAPLPGGAGDKAPGPEKNLEKKAG
jgi:hypothetical protein